ncbi:MAG TPA: carbon-nitrogen hydrolase family protein [Spirochaetota bacterium]|nr:carbon-nitrogen hydrolase family protein [Spirochaetota bacterium]HPI89950.1 carbon-nitrogen hydrolase family protein [Spirochaetota bacterium]HPR48451.1 carbon-nitrogen hydrolase family protein [Spirochaetota bacterium]
MASFNIALCQKPLGTAITRKDIAVLKNFRPHFICFPEYFFVNRYLGNHGQTPHNQRMQQKRIEILSRETDSVVIGGTMPESSGGQLYNTTYVYDRGNFLGKYRKKHLFQPEVGIITPGDAYAVFSAHGITFGVLICADVFHDSSFMFMKNAGAKIIFSPTFSLIKNETVEQKFSRDQEIYVRGANISGAVIVKVCGVKSNYKPYLQARSLIAAPGEILYRVRPEEEHTSMIITHSVTLGHQ